MPQKKYLNYTKKNLTNCCTTMKNILMQLKIESHNTLWGHSYHNVKINIVAPARYIHSTTIAALVACCGPVLVYCEKI